MPANLTAQYKAAEERYRQAVSSDEKIECLREMLAVIPKHKGTEKLQADLKHKLSKLQHEEEQHRRSGGRRHDPGHVPKEGAGQIALIGPPNSGKSAILRTLSHAEPEVAEYPFTTRVPQPGMVPFEDAQVQVVDTPPIAAEPFDPMLVNVARGADAIFFVFDPTDIEILDQVACLPKFLARCRVVPAGRPIPEELALSARVLPVHRIWSKIDRITAAGGGRLEAEAIDAEIQTLEELARPALGDDLPAHRISVETGFGLDALRRAFWDVLGAIRVYAKEPGKEPDMTRPFVFKRGTTVIHFAQSIHKDLAAHLKFARIWGSTKFDGQPAERDHLLEDQDVVEIHV